MRFSHYALTLLAATLVLAGCGRESTDDARTPEVAGATVAAADTLLTNGKIYTLNTAEPWAEAVAIKDGKYSYVGSATDARNYLGENTRVIDLQGKMAMPGINDAHSHPWQGGVKVLFECSFPFSATPDEIAATIESCVQANPDAEWVRGGQWTSDFFKNYPIESPRAWLDQVSADKAVMLEDDAGHNAWVNSKALALAGIDKNTPDPRGGTIVRDKQGEPNGLVLEAAKHMIEHSVPEWTHEQYVAALVEAVRQANSFGITGINEARTPAAVSPAYQQLDHEGRLTAHAVTSLQTPRGQRDEHFDIEPLVQISEQYGSAHVHTRFVKIYLDGVPTASRSAVMVEPYLVDDDFPETTTGVLLIKPEALARDLIELDRRGFTVKIHTAGDGAVRIALDAIAKMRETNGNSGLRPELAHAGYIHPDDLPRFAQLNVTADLSPYIWFPSPIIDSIKGAVGERGERYFPVKDLLDSGANVLIGSDWPSAVDNMNPWPGVEALVTRKNPHLDNNETLWPEQAITLEQALKIFTLDGATAYRLEQVTGSIAVGKSADLIVLNQHLFNIPADAISDTRIEKTFFEGRVVYEDGNNP